MHVGITVDSLMLLPGIARVPALGPGAAAAEPPGTDSDTPDLILLQLHIFCILTVFLFCFWYGCQICMSQMGFKLLCYLC